LTIVSSFLQKSSSGFLETALFQNSTLFSNWEVDIES
jgi:hypothetical protein